MSLRDSWKQTGTGLGHAFRDLGKSLVRTAVTVTKKAENWVEEDEKAPESEQPMEAEVVQNVESEEKAES